MLTPRKTDSDEIRGFMEGLASSLGLRDSRKWWPNYVFHFTDIQNAVEILKSECLFSRAKLEQSGKMKVDNASKVVLAQTDEQVKKYVRFYFRPQTPTQYRNEGIRPKSNRKLDAHCPVPVFFLFDSIDILTRRDSRFSQGNLASRNRDIVLCQRATELKQFDFIQIYHTGPMRPIEKEKVIFHRNAEVVVPDEIDLSALKFIICRSKAEKGMLIHLLPPSVLQKWGRKILVATKSKLFECRWTFLENVVFSANMIHLHFSPDSETPGPFKLQVEVTDLETSKKYSLDKEPFMANKHLALNPPPNVSKFLFKVMLDDDLAFINEFNNYADEDIF